jgi:NADH:ubiquinone oxidoreductase subunit E
MPEKTLGPEDVEKVEAICARFEPVKSSVIPVLQEIEEAFGYISEEAVNIASERFKIPQSHFYGVATFYAQFHFKPRGKNIVTACTGTACHVKGSARLIESLKRGLEIPEDGETSPDMNFSVEKVNCIGACSIAPVMVVHNKIHGKMDTSKVSRLVRGLRRHPG